jgi:protein SCO1/2
MADATSKRHRLTIPILALLAFAALVAAGSLLWQSLQETRDASIGGSFTLTDADGRVVSDADFRGKYLLVYFGYTYCPDICPTTMADLGIALRKMGPAADSLQPLFITVDPDRDTPEVLKRYTAQFSPRLLGLTGTLAQIKKVEKSYKVYTERHTTGPGSDDYLMDHSSLYYLMDPEGHFVAVLDAGQPSDALAEDIRQHMEE